MGENTALFVAKDEGGGIITEKTANALRKLNPDLVFLIVTEKGLTTEYWQSKGWQIAEGLTEDLKPNEVEAAVGSIKPGLIVIGVGKPTNLECAFFEIGSRLRIPVVVLEDCRGNHLGLCSGETERLPSLMVVRDSNAYELAKKTWPEVECLRSGPVHSFAATKVAKAILALLAK